MTHSYGEWRRMQKELPDTCRLFQFEDDPRKSDQEVLCRKIETVPLWRPGLAMRAHRAGG